MDFLRNKLMDYLGSMSIAVLSGTGVLYLAALLHLSSLWLWIYIILACFEAAGVFVFVFDAAREKSLEE